MHAFALGGLEGHRQALEPAVDEKLSGGEEFIGGLSKAGLLVKGELAEEGDGVATIGAHTASVLDGEGVVVGAEEDLGLKHACSVGNCSDLNSKRICKICCDWFWLMVMGV